MRRVLPLLVLVGCWIDVEDPDIDGPDAAVHDAGPVDCGSYVWCDDGTLYRTPPLEDQPYCPPPRSEGVAYAQCGSECLTEVARVCSEDVCTPGYTEVLCWRAPDPITCTLDASPCNPDGAIESCDASLVCGVVAQVGACACTGGAWDCQPACADGLCSADEVLAAMVGTWQGNVDPPYFTDPYQMSLEILPDGHYVPDCSERGCSGFYYGLDGPHPKRRLWVEAQTELGAHLGIDIVFYDDTGPSRGLITNLRVDADSMSFEYRAAWIECDQPFVFTLQRVR